MALIALDFDGVLNDYHGWKGEKHLADIRPGAYDFIRELKRRGYSLCIHTCRDPIQVRDWLQKFGLSRYVDFVTGNKPSATCYIDDRAISFRGDYAEILAEIETFQPYWQAPPAQAEVDSEVRYQITPKGAATCDLSKAIDRLLVEQRLALAALLQTAAQALLAGEPTLSAGLQLADAMILLGYVPASVEEIRR